MNRSAHTFHHLAAQASTHSSQTECLSPLAVQLRAVFLASLALIAAGCSSTAIFHTNFDSDALNALPAPNPPGEPNKDLFRIADQNSLKIIVWDSVASPGSANPQNHAFEMTHGIQMDDELLVPAPQFHASLQNTFELGPYTQGKFDVAVLGYVPVGSYNQNDEFFILLSKLNDLAKLNGTYVAGGIKGVAGELYAISANGMQPLGVSYAAGQELWLTMKLDLDQSTVSFGAFNFAAGAGGSLDELPMMGSSKSFSSLAFGILRPAGVGGIPGKFVVDNIRVGTDEDNVQPD